MKELYTKMKVKKKKGLTLIEALLFLGIAAVVIVGAVVLYNNTSNSQRTNDALAQIQAYSTGVKGMYSGQSNYGTGSLAAVVINGGIAPDNAVNGTGLVNPWGNPSHVFGTNDRFQIAFESVPQDACVRILSSNLLTNGGITNIWTANAATISNAVNSIPSGANSFTAPNDPTPAQAAAACANINNNIFMVVR